MSDATPTIVRADPAEMLRDRRMWYLRTVPDPGRFLLAERDGLYVVGFEADAGRSWFAPVEEVVCLGRPDNGPAFLVRRSLRLEVQGRRMIITFSGSAADGSGDLLDAQQGRITGDLDPVAMSPTAVTAVRNVRPALSASKDAADVWLTFFDEATP